MNQLMEFNRCWPRIRSSSVSLSDTGTHERRRTDGVCDIVRWTADRDLERSAAFGVSDPALGGLPNWHSRRRRSIRCVLDRPGSSREFGGVDRCVPRRTLGRHRDRRSGRGRPSEAAGLRVVRSWMGASVGRGALAANDPDRCRADRRARSGSRGGRGIPRLVRSGLRIHADPHEHQPLAGPDRRDGGLPHRRGPRPERRRPRRSRVARLRRVLDLGAVDGRHLRRLRPVGSGGALSRPHPRRVGPDLPRDGPERADDSLVPPSRTQLRW